MHGAFDLVCTCGFCGTYADEIAMWEAMQQHRARSPREDTFPADPLLLRRRADDRPFSEQAADARRRQEGIERELAD